MLSDGNIVKKFMKKKSASFWHTLHLKCTEVLSFHLSHLLSFVFVVCARHAFYFYTSFKNKCTAISKVKNVFEWWHARRKDPILLQIISWRFSWHLSDATVQRACRMTSEIKHWPRTLKAAVKLSADGIGPITPGEGGIPLCCGDLSTCECHRLVFLARNVAGVKWPLNCDTLHTTAAAVWVTLAVHSERSTVTTKTWKREECAWKVHNVSEKGAITGKSTQLK